MDNKSKEYDLRTLKERLLLAADKEKYNLSDVSRKTGISYKTVYKHHDMNNDESMNIPSLVKYCNLYGCDMDYLFGKMGNKTHDLKFICEFMGLSEDTVSGIANASYWFRSLLEFFVSHPRLFELIDEYANIDTDDFKLNVRYVEQTETPTAFDQSGEPIDFDVDFEERENEIHGIEELVVNNYHINPDVIKRSILDSVKEELDKLAADTSDNWNRNMENFRKYHILELPQC